MTQAVRATLEPRKTPVQARSTASVDAILEATIQVLIEVSKERLTTTRVAQRAGVSVGTLYQYFPNKSALLRAVLERHLGSIADAVEAACGASQGKPLETMAAALVTAFFDAKMKNAKNSRALHAVSDDVDGITVVREVSRRFTKAIAAMLETAPEGLTTDAEIAASMLQGAMVGVSRRMLETGTFEKQRIEAMRGEAIILAGAYLKARASNLGQGSKCPKVNS